MSNAHKKNPRAKKQKKKPVHLLIIPFVLIIAIVLVFELLLKKEPRKEPLPTETETIAQTEADSENKNEINRSLFEASSGKVELVTVSDITDEYFELTNSQGEKYRLSSSLSDDYQMGNILGITYGDKKKFQDDLYTIKPIKVQKEEVVSSLNAETHASDDLTETESEIPAESAQNTAPAYGETEKEEEYITLSGKTNR